MGWDRDAPYMTCGEFEDLEAKGEASWQLRAEIERLQAENRAFALREKSLQDEIERLRAAAVDHSPGTPLGRLADKEKFSIKRLVEARGMPRPNFKLMAEHQSNEIARLSAEIERLQAAAVDHSPGTPLGRLADLARYAQKMGLCSGLEAKPSELFLIDEIVRLENELTKAQFQRNDRPMIRNIIRSLILEIRRLRLELREAKGKR